MPRELLRDRRGRFRRDPRAARRDLSELQKRGDLVRRVLARDDTINPLDALAMVVWGPHKPED